MSELESGSQSQVSEGASESASPSTSQSAATAQTPKTQTTSSSQGVQSSGSPANLSALKAIAEKVQNAASSESQSKALSDEKASEAVSTPLVPPVFTPNFKVKFLDPEINKQSEKEIEEWAKGFIKDKETEEKFQKLYAKAYGLDAAVASREKHKTESGKFRQENTDIKKGLNILSSYVANDDMHSFFQAAKIPEDKVLKYALERVQYREWTPEQRAAYDGQRDAAARAQFLEEQNQNMHQQMQEVAVQSKTSELEQTMRDPKVSQIVEAFDARMGQGAFRNEVVRRGQLYWHQYQQDIPAHQAVNEVLQLIGGVPQQAQTPPAEEVSPNVGSPSGIQLGSNQTPEKKKPIIPNIQGSGASPAKKVPKSIADLKRIREQMEA